MYNIIQEEESFAQNNISGMASLLAIFSNRERLNRHSGWLVSWLVVLRINVDLAIFQPYLDLKAGDNQSLKIQVARPGIEPRPSCSAIQELNRCFRIVIQEIIWSIRDLIKQYEVSLSRIIIKWPSGFWSLTGTVTSQPIRLYTDFMTYR